jgi:hypothetical protein
VALRVKVVAADVVPVADDQCGVAVRAESGAAFAVVDVAGEDVVQAGVEGDVAAWWAVSRQLWPRVVINSAGPWWYKERLPAARPEHVWQDLEEGDDDADSHHRRGQWRRRSRRWV